MDSVQANVYHGTSPTTPPISTNPSSPYPDPYPASIALKVYKTSILSFKTRSAYMVGDNRLKNSYTAVSNPRKMVRTWAEKELRNLRRLWNGGVKCPVVVDVRENVLVMEFLGGVDGRRVFPFLRFFFSCRKLTCCGPCVNSQSITTLERRNYHEKSPPRLVRRIVDCNAKDVSYLSIGSCGFK